MAPVIATNVSSDSLQLGGIAAASYALAETVVTGKFTTATSGNRYFWDTGTNVSLSATLTAGQVVNYALLRNTNATAITATGEVGWKWTGGAMTNTVPGGCGMTFGWSCNPVTGNTNAYATAASAN
jgi:hypothetical protein